MHLPKLFSAVLAAGTLLVPAICEVDTEFHVARSRVDFQRRNLEAKLRSLDPIEGALDERALLRRGLTSKAPAKTSTKTPPSASSGSKSKSRGHKHHLIKPKTCSVKRASGSKAKRAPDSPNRKQVEAGHIEKGGGFDQLETWSLKTCIGMAAANKRGTKKVLAHINAIDWESQIAKFKSTVQSHAPDAKVTVSFPSTNEGPEHLHQALGERIVGAEQAAQSLDSNYAAVDRAKGASGEMVIRVDGQVECC